MLPEALLESISFISEKSIKDSLKNFLGIEGGLTNDVQNVLKEYIKICHIRHCAVHRFGKLGSNNAIALDLDKHKQLLEKPLKLDFDTLQEIFFTLSMTVKTVNNFIFRKILTRSVNETGYWTWDLRSDSNKFFEYYNTFSTKLDTPKSKPLKEVYDQFREASK